MPVTWLHVSDFHIREGDPYDRNVVLSALVSSVRRMREKDGPAPDLIFATGDIAFSGKPAEYAMATKFFDDLLDAAGLDRRRLFVIPGNHDVDRKLGLGLARTLDTPELADAYFDPEVPKVHLTQKLGAYVKWHNKYFRHIRKAPTDTTTGPVELVEVQGTRIGILPLNSALFCLGDDDHAKLLIGRRALEPGLDGLRALRADLNVALIHHPLEWLSDIDRSNIRTTLQENVDVVLRGHLHESDVESTITAHGGFLHVAAGAAYQTRKWPNRALYGTFDGTAMKVFPIRYEDKPKEAWVVDPSVFPDDAEAGHAHAFGIPRLTSVPVVRAPTQQPTSPQQPASTLQFRSNIQPRHNLPFVGRDGLLDEMCTVFADTSREAALVLHGQPGVGKSELAREYARLHRQQYPGGTFLIRAGSGGESVDLAHIGKVQLGLEFPADLSIQEQGEQTLLSLGSSPVLLIYDNATSEDGVTPWLPPAGIPCHVVATTNLEHWSPRWRRLEVERLPDGESLDLVGQVGGKQVAARFGDELVRIAGGLPVQLVPAAMALAYEERRGRLDGARADLMPQARDSFRVPYESLGDPERLLLHSAAFLNIQRIIRDELFHQLEIAVGWSEAEFRDRLDACLDLHLLEGGEELRMHQLFASFLLGVQLSPDTVSELTRIRAVQRVRFEIAASGVAAYPTNSEVATRLLGYRLRPIEWDATGLEISIETGELVGYALSQLGKWSDARPWFERAVEAKQKDDGRARIDYQGLGFSLYRVANCLWFENNFEEARSWFERAAIAKQHGAGNGRINYSDVGESLYRAGYCCIKMRNPHTAQSWCERAVAATQLGNVDGHVDHASLSKCLYMLGTSLGNQGKDEEAKLWYERAIEAAEKDDVHSPSTMYWLGLCLEHTGKYDAARSWFEHAVEKLEQGDVHGRIDHQELGRVLFALAGCFDGANDYEAAQLQFECGVDELEKGDRHGRIDQIALGRGLWKVGNFVARVWTVAEAQPWYERAVEAAEKGDLQGYVDYGNQGQLHYSIGNWLSGAGKFDEARLWFVRAVEAAEKGELLGYVDYRGMGISLHEVGFCLSRVGKFQEAQLWLERAVEAMQRGDVLRRVDHQGLGQSLHAVGTCLSRQERFGEARLWYQRAVEARQQADDYGAVNHTSLGSSMHWVGWCLASEENFEEAQPWFERAIEAMRKGDLSDQVNGRSLRTTLQVGAECLRELGRADEAKVWEDEAAKLATEQSSIGSDAGVRDGSAP
jgi:tetratricopeptide (TPR) repeat protein/predicted phosphodiesterase